MEGNDDLVPAQLFVSRTGRNNTTLTSRISLERHRCFLLPAVLEVNEAIVALVFSRKQHETRGLQVTLITSMTPELQKLWFVSGFM